METSEYLKEKQTKTKKTHKNKSECVRRVCGTSFVIALVYKNHSIFSLYFLDVFSFNQIPKICWRILTLIIISQYWKSDHWLNLMTFFLGSWSESLLLNVKQHFFFLNWSSPLSQTLQWIFCWLWQRMLTDEVGSHFWFTWSNSLPSWTF